MTDEQDTDRILWPDVPRLCFGPGPNRELDAEVAWVQSRKEFYAYIEGYRRAATTLLASLETEHQNPNYMFWPIAFLWRHHIELSLKDIIATGRLLEEQEGIFPPHHRLKDLWREARRHIEACGSPDSPELENVAANIEEFESLDPYAVGFRYPLDRDGVDASLRAPPFMANLRVLHEAMDALANFFDAVRSEMSVRLDNMHEMYAAYRFQGP